jgi:7,8-dihydroneopterin aldolase/epimerase/oxygenase
VGSTCSGRRPDLLPCRRNDASSPFLPPGPPCYAALMADTAPPRLRRVFIRGLELQARLGVHAHEKVGPQRIVVHVDLDVQDDGPDVGPDALSRVVDYEQVVLAARQAVSGGHVLLVETLAESLAALALRDHRVLSARVSIEKPDAFSDVAAVGVTVERSRSA